MKSINIGITFEKDDGHKIEQTATFPSPACPDVKALLELIVDSISEETGQAFVLRRDTRKMMKELGYEQDTAHHRT